MAAMPHDTRTATLSLPDAPPQAGGPGQVVITRQPIFDTTHRTIGYELQSLPLQDAPGSPDILPVSGVSDAPDASTQLVRKTMHEALHVVGLDALLGDARLFLPVTPRVMTQDDYLLLPPDRTCLKLPGHVTMTPDLAAACQRARQAGYTLAVDQPPTQPAHQAMLAMAQIMRVPLEPHGQAALRGLIDAQRADGPALLAANVQTHDDLDHARSLGARYVQGYYFAQPQPVAGRELAGVQCVRLRFLSELQKPELNFERLEEIIKTDVALTCHLLRYLNSAAVGLRRKVTSIHQALLLLGERPLRQWGSLVALTALGSDRPHELVVSSLVRARFCEKLAGRCRMEAHAMDLFLVGLLSLLDTLLGLPMPQALAGLPLNDVVTDVLLHQKPGPAMTIHTLACATQRGAWGSAIQASSQLGLPQHEIATLYYATLQWTHQLLNAPAG